MLSRRDLVLATGLTPFARTATKQRPNIVLIMSDDQGFGDLSIHGNPHLKTPAIDSIARQGMEFTQFHVNPVCSPTRASLLTGRYYYRTGVVDTYLGRAMMHNDEVTLAEVLQAEGYKTGIFGKWHLGDHYPLRPTEQGFEEALVHEGGGIGQPSDPPDGNSYFNPKLVHNGKREQNNGYCTDVFFNAAMQFISQNRNLPFFTYLATNAPHSPLQVDEAYVAPFRSKGLDETTAKTYGMLVNLDENVARLLAHLKRERLEENTILIFMTDNGPIPARFNSGMRGIKGTVYEGGIRVPFFLRWPGTVRAGVKIDRLAAHIDIFPTLLEACGVAPPKEKPIDGKSLLPLLRHPDDAAAWPERTLFFQWHRGERGELYNSCAARSQRYKLVNGKELYDLQDDPAEAHDIAAAHAGRVAQFRAAYETWFRDVASTRNFEVPRIYLGTEYENPVMLTRQDWRGPRASWEETGLGFWEVDVREAGRYECRLIFPATGATRTAWVSLRGAKAETKIGPGVNTAAVRLEDLTAGPGRLEAGLTEERKLLPIGPHYIEIGRK